MFPQVLEQRGANPISPYFNYLRIPEQQHVNNNTESEVASTVILIKPLDLEISANLDSNDKDERNRLEQRLFQIENYLRNRISTSTFSWGPSKNALVFFSSPV
jgi:hypothetical protein